MTDLPSLHSIANAIIDAAQVNEDGELTPEAVERLEALGLTLEQKVEAYHYVYAELTTQACASKELAAYYEKRAKAPKAAAERLKERLKAELERLGTTSLKTPTCTVAIQPSPESVDIEKGAIIPNEYALPRQNEADKKRIMQALKCGIALPFAKLVQSTHLRFR
jgi:nucleotide-binding universal stress UspA family protein